MKAFKLAPQSSPVLHRVNALITTLPDSAIERLVPPLIDAMHRHNGIGIAAPQVGLDLQLIAVNLKDESLVLVNPVITRRSFRTQIDEEGCLSVPSVFCRVKRARTVWIRAQSLTGDTITMKVSGMLARVLQHETDHINGLLIVDRAISTIPKG